MKRRVITISREYGSGGHAIGESVASSLGIPFYDKKILEIVSQRSGLDETVIEEQGEHAATGFLYGLAASISYGYGYNVGATGSMILPDQINAFQTELIGELADKESCVIIGRCSDYILRKRDDCLHVFIHADMENKKSRVAKEYGIAMEDAEAQIKDRDKKRARYYQHVTDRTWGVAKNYHLCLDSGVLSAPACVDAILYLFKHI